MIWSRRKSFLLERFKHYTVTGYWLSASAHHVDHCDPRSRGAAQASVIHLSCLDHSNHAVKLCKTWLENLTVSPTPTRLLAAFSLFPWNAPLIVREIKKALLLLERSHTCIARGDFCLLIIDLQPSEHYEWLWASVAGGPLQGWLIAGGRKRWDRIPVATWHIALVTWHTVHFAVVTWQSPLRLGQWNIRDVCGRNAFTVHQDYVWHFSFCLCLSISHVSLLVLRDIERWVRALCLFYQSCSWGIYDCQHADKQTSKDKWAPQLSGLCSYVLPF